jgi:hypothetical protein
MYPIVSRTNEADKGQLEVLTANTILAGHSNFEATSQTCSTND